MNKTGFDPAKNMDSVFAQNTDSELDFDIMFDQEDQLIDIVAGFNEAGEPLVGVDFETLHQDSDEAKVSDFNKELDTNGDAQGASNPEGTSDYKDNKVAVGDKGESDATKFEKDADKEYQKEKLEPKHEDFDMFDLDIFGEDAPDEPSTEPVFESDDFDPQEYFVNGGQEDIEESVDDLLDEAAIDLFLMEAEEGSLLNGKDEDAEARNSKSCNCGKANCPICGSAPNNAEGTNKFEDDEVAVGVKGESDASRFEKDADKEYQNESVEDILDELAIDLFIEKCNSGAGSDLPEEEMDDEDVDLDEAFDLFMESEDDIDDMVSDDDDEDVDLDEAAIDLMIMEAIDSDVKKVDDEDDEDDVFVDAVDGNKKKAGKLEYEYSDEELIDSLM